MAYRLKIALMAALAVMLLLFGCANPTGSDDDDNGGGGGTSTATGNRLTYQGETVRLTQLVFDDFGQWDTGVYNIDIYLAPSGIDFVNDTGTGKFVYLEMLFDTPTVSAGTYTWAPEATATAGQFTDFSDISEATTDEVFYDQLTGGTVTITITGTTYNIQGTVATETGDTATFSYEGVVTLEF